MTADTVTEDESLIGSSQVNPGSRTMAKETPRTAVTAQDPSLADAVTPVRTTTPQRSGPDTRYLAETWSPEGRRCRAETWSPEG